MNKRHYITQDVEQIRLDHEISLQLESLPPIPGDEGISSAPEYFIKDPFKNIQC